MIFVCAFIMQNGHTTVIVAKHGKEEIMKMNKESKSMKFRGDIKHGKLASSAPSVKAVRRFRTKPYEAANLVKKQVEYLSELPHE